MSGFHKNKTEKDGHSHWCKKCQCANTQYHNRTPNGLWQEFRRKAKKLGNHISESEYIELRKRPCYYCDEPLPEAGRGADRIDNTKGYITGNVAPCCTRCNVLKRDATFSEFELIYKNWAKLLTNHKKNVLK